ncbi:hypothetical protein [Hydrogenimonas cancrithermarum]|uniref:DUF4115 domain-containing protein n=1 Tax=Hydrogenimonas cancrithermarum TaxID=2993563 RepID=A0ABM8FMQ1_9BACT|nr:hypothetical protein [Hydrogenimonas cancrithermarum]BDY12763.1 hypothetical protein HCR_10750 [Hydrogenimonas cancrithermarum]
MFERIVEQYSIEVVVNRTKISKKNLEKLQSGDFEGFTKPQAYGFVKILEREFDEDFSDLKSALDAWFSQSGTGSEEVFVAVERGEPAKSKIWIVLALAAVVLFLALYLFRQEFSSREEKALSVSTQEKAQVVKPEKEGVLPEGAVEKENGSSGTDETQKRPASAAEQSGSSVMGTEVKEEEKRAASEPYVPVENAVITPLVKLWFGVIDLKTKKRIAKVTDKPYEIDSTGKKLLVTGHGRFEISDAFGNLFKFNDAKKHYFLIDDGMVKEIGSDEFKRLNGGKGW